MLVDRQESHLLAALYDRPLPAKALRQILGDISPATLSRITKQAGGKVVVFGQARASTYARPRDLRGLGCKFPVYRVDQAGNANFTGELWSLYGGYWWRGEGKWPSQFYPYLPWFIQDMRPDGFVGRAFAQRLGMELGLPDRLINWKDDDVLVALLKRGEDTIGDLIIGDESVVRYLTGIRDGSNPVEVADYPALARAALAGDPAGSSAGGEQPKFTALTQKNGNFKRVLVKFSPLISTVSGQRWSDLLVCEHIALSILKGIGMPASESSVLQQNDRTFLEVERFDRIGLYGRSPVISLTVVDAEFIGEGSNWAAAADALLTIKKISPEDAQNLSKLDFFGHLIANTDRHYGNISLVPVNEERTIFRLSPTYDMLPMFYKPGVGEELNRQAYPSVASGKWPEIYEAAKKFWKEAASDQRISESFRGVCLENYEQMLRLESGPRIIGHRRP